MQSTTFRGTQSIFLSATFPTEITTHSGVTFNNLPDMLTRAPLVSSVVIGTMFAEVPPRATRLKYMVQFEFIFSFKASGLGRCLHPTIKTAIATRTQ
jgi:hypothetical protein